MAMISRRLIEPEQIVSRRPGRVALHLHGDGPGPGTRGRLRQAQRVEPQPHCLRSPAAGRSTRDTARAEGRAPRRGAKPVSGSPLVCQASAICRSVAVTQIRSVPTAAGKHTHSIRRAVESCARGRTGPSKTTYRLRDGMVHRCRRGTEGAGFTATDRDGCPPAYLLEH